ncbi:putative terpene synthase 11 [Canna indica]|uniref:Terpene synthase 11 n=1 Tax=Canna indica TaxID=4628 RepID=A0AAQ3KZY7_9LILI|nr:putative terpene synthase 11 [Canna indica]
MAGILGACLLPSAASSAKWRRRDTPLAANLTANSHNSRNLHGCFASFSSLREHQVHLETDYSTETRIEELKKRVQSTLCTDIYSTRTMTIIDTIQQLGISHQFEDQIELILERNIGITNEEDDLFSTALRFRLFRQGGHTVSTDVFHKFMDKNGRFKESMSKDLRGLLSLHEASYLSTKDEEVLLQAMEFSKEHLQRQMLHLNPSAARDVGLTLEFPRHRRMVRAEARNHIRAYGEESGRAMDMLELANLDFDLVQSQHKMEIAMLRSWWKELGLAEKLSFARDRPLECFLWTVGLFPDPRFSTCRIEIAKTVAILLVIDDVYDIHGSLEELVLFTNAVKRWEIEAMEDLPEYMKICYMALYNTTNEIGYRVLKEHGKCIISELRKTWVDLCEGFLIESRWYNSRIVPNLEEYVSNGVTTAGTYMALVHAFYLMGNKINKESSALVNSCPKLFTSAGRLLRLWDDLGTAKDEQERGDVASSMQCFMKEAGVASEEEGRLHIRKLIHSAWLDLNGEAFAATSTLPRSIVDVALNLARASQAMYQHGDDERVPGIKQHIQTLLMDPIR